MLESTLKAFDTCYNIFDEIKAGRVKESELKAVFLELAKLEYQTKHDAKIEYYINRFEWFHDKDLFIQNNYLRTFSKEHYKYVRKPFWPLYKKHCKESTREFKISPSDLLHKLKEIERERKNKK